MSDTKPYNPYYPPPKRGVKDFFMMLFASMLGFLIAGFGIIFVTVGFFFILIAGLSSSETVTVAPGSILKITMRQAIIDSPKQEDDPFANLFAEESGKKTSLQEYVNAIKSAKEDSNIKAIYLEVGDANGNLANLEEIWNALADFRKSGKKIIAYSDFYSLRGLYMASVADSIYLNPRGGVMLKGLSAEVPMFKNLLNSIGLDVQVIRAGKYKSAVEPFIANNMSEENKTQMREYLTGLWGSILTKISQKTNLDLKKLNSIADSLSVFDAVSAKNAGVVDELVYNHQIDSVVKKNLKLSEKPEYISFENYLKTGAGKFKYKTSDEIRIIYAEGDIVMGKSNDDNIGSETFVKAVKAAAEDESVKAVVLRVNSPGGSAMASDIMYRELQILRSKKPLIISMGNYAASGGYYISAPGDVIVASPNTLTGSIGVFGLVMNTQKLMRDKLGINFDTVKTNPYADFFTGSRPMTNYELSVMQMNVDTTYETFLGIVAKGRKISRDEANEIGQGRIWFAPAAMDKKLVDTLGGLYDAVNIAAKKAKLKDYTVSYSSTSETFFQKLIRNLEARVSTFFIKSETARKLEFYIKEVERVSNMSGVMMVMPVGFTW